MSVKKRGLGRGLSDLGLNELLSRMTSENLEATPKDDGELRKISIDHIVPGKYQPRREIDTNALEELAESIRSQGIIQPIVVRSIGQKRFEIIAGERRWRAAQLTDLKEIPAIIRDIPDEAAIAMALIENIQRENLNAIEEALALHRLSEEFALTHQEIAKIVGKSRATITNLLRLLTLSSDVKNLVEKGALEMGHARALLTLHPEKQIEIAKRIVSKEMSVRETELYIRRLQNLTDNPAQKAPKNIDLRRLEKKFSQKFGMRVTIKPKDDQKGKLILHYHTQDQLNAFLNQIDES